MTHSFFLLLLLLVVPLHVDAQSTINEVEYEVSFNAFLGDGNAGMETGRVWIESVFELLKEGEIQAFQFSKDKGYVEMTLGELRNLLFRVDTVYVTGPDARNKPEMKIIESNVEPNHIESFKFRENWTLLPSGEVDKSIEAMAFTVSLFNAAGEKTGENKELFWLRY